MIPKYKEKLKYTDSSKEELECLIYTGMESSTTTEH